MKLLSEINEAAEALIEKTANIQQFMDVTGLGIEPISEAVTQFLTNFATKIEKGDFQPSADKKNEAWQKQRKNVISIFAAIHALADLPTALSFQPDPTHPGVETEIDRNAVPVGSVLGNFYGKNGAEAHKIAKHRLIEIGSTVSPTILAQAEKAVDDPTRIREYANKLQVSIEPVMNKLLSQERNEATARLQNQQKKEKKSNMARPLQGAVPQRS